MPPDSAVQVAVKESVLQRCHPQASSKRVTMIILVSACPICPARIPWLVRSRPRHEQPPTRSLLRGRLRPACSRRFSGVNWGPTQAICELFGWSGRGGMDGCSHRALWFSSLDTIPAVRRSHRSLQLRLHSTWNGRDPRLSLGVGVRLMILCNLSLLSPAACRPGDNITATVQPAQTMHAC